MIHAVNKLIPELVPISVDMIYDWLDDLGLDSSIMSDEEAAELAFVAGSPIPELLAHLLLVKSFGICRTTGGTTRVIIHPPKVTHILLTAVLSAILMAASQRTVLGRSPTQMPGSLLSSPMIWDFSSLKRMLHPILDLVRNL